MYRTLIAQVLFLILALSFAGCSSLADYSSAYTPSQSNAGKICVTQCIQKKIKCEQTCSINWKQCKKEEAVLSTNYRNNHPNQFQFNNAHQISLGCQDCMCVPQLQTCYTTCGGHVEKLKEIPWRA